MTLSHQKGAGALSGRLLRKNKRKSLRRKKDLVQIFFRVNPPLVALFIGAQASMGAEANGLDPLEIEQGLTSEGASLRYDQVTHIYITVV
jgi:hypothetical protein